MAYYSNPNPIGSFIRTHLPSTLDESSYFHHNLQDAIKDVNRIISSDRNPQLASPDQEHSYDDKFTLSEYLTNVAMTAMCNAFDAIGESTFEFPQLISACEEKEPVTLRFVANEKCELIVEEEREVESPVSYVEETKSILNMKTTRKVISKVKHYHWSVTIDYEAYVFVGNKSDASAETSLSIFKGSIPYNIVKRGSKENPAGSPASRIKPIDVSLNELLKHMKRDTSNVEYSIDRSLDSCRTPKHNVDTQAAWEFFEDMASWCDGVRSYFIERQRQYCSFHDKSEHEILLTTVDDSSVFNPVLPLFGRLHEDNSAEVKNAEAGAPSATTTTSLQVILPSEDVQKLLSEQSRTLIEETQSIESHFATENEAASSSRLMRAMEATMTLYCKHLTSICTHWAESINLIENMLSSQLYDAIGKKVTGRDIDDFVRFHNKKFFSDTFAPEDFCYSIRRPNQYPDGLLSIEQEGDANTNVNAMTFTRRLENTQSSPTPMYIPINSATTVNFKGPIYLHSWMLQRFQKEKFNFHLAARARQFSSFLLLIGKVSGPDMFDPEHGIILQNKDEALIPLLLDELPSAKEFKDAIKSLSPEQQQFAQSFRSMKLASSVVGICVIQLKPQLELLLGLPDKSLTKEIQLTQDLMELFVEYQIPSDLLSYEGGSDVGTSEMIDVVKGQVKSVKAIIESAKENELKNAKQKAKMANPLHYTNRSSFSSDDMEVECEEEGGSFDLYGSAPVSKCVPPPLPAAAAAFRAEKMSMPVPKRMPMKSLKSTGAGRGGLSAPRSSSKRYMSKPVEQGQMESMSFHSMNTPGKEVSPENITNKNAVSNAKPSTQDFLNHDTLPDFTTIPKVLDAKFEAFAESEKYAGTLRSVVIKVGEYWKKKHQPNLLSPFQSSQIGLDEQTKEKNRAFDLLDALSRSGSLDIACAEMHILVASSHSFDKAVVNTVIQDNINPIEKIERSQLLLASMIHGVACRDLIRDESDYDRIAASSPLFLTKD